MPEMDGHELCRRVKARPELRSIPIIFVSSKGETEDEAHGFKLGAVDYVTKPVIPALLMSRVRTHIELAHLVHL